MVHAEVEWSRGRLMDRRIRRRQRQGQPVQVGDDAGQVPATMAGMHQGMQQVAVAVMVFRGNPGFMLAHVMQVACLRLAGLMQVTQRSEHRIHQYRQHQQGQRRKAQHLEAVA